MYTDWYPDGLTPELIDALITECLPDALPRPAHDRRQRREARRALSSVVRTLPLTTPGEVAA